MAKTEYLTPLIKSLSPNEKRSFRLFSSFQSGDKKYIQLFDLLENGDKHSVAALAQKLKLPEKQVAPLKNYLGQVLLKSLSTFSQPASEADTLYEQLLEARLLINRNLHAHALAVIDRTLLRAGQIEKYELVDDLLFAKYKCLFHLNRVQDAIALGSAYKRVANITAELTDLRGLELHIKQMEMTREKIAFIIEEQIAVLKKKKPEEMLSISAASYRFRILFYYYGIKGNVSDMLDTARKEQAYYQKHPALKEFDTTNYLLSIINLCNAEVFSRNYTQALKSLDAFLALLNEKKLKCPEQLKQTLQHHTSVQRLQMLFYLHRMADVLQIAGNEEWKAKMNYSQHFNTTFKQACALIHMKRTGEAIEKLNYLIQQNTDVWVPLQQSLRALLVMAHISHGNQQLVPYLIKSARAWMKRKKYTNPELDLFFTLIGKMLKMPAGIPVKKARQPIADAVKEGRLPFLTEEAALSIWAAGG